MNHSDLINSIKEGNPTLTQEQANQLVSLILKNIIRAVDAGERVELRGFGSFFPRSRKSRMGRNPRTGEVVDVAAKRVLFFKVGRGFLARLNDQKVTK